MRAAILLAFLTLAAHGQSPLERAPAKVFARSNPFEGNETARRAGAKVFHNECAACHGSQAEGMGKAPALARREVQQAPPGAIFWVLRNGSLHRGMPSFAHLPEPRLWQVVTYLRWW